MIGRDERIYNGYVLRRCNHHVSVEHGFWKISRGGRVIDTRRTLKAAEKLVNKLRREEHAG